MKAVIPHFTVFSELDKKSLDIEKKKEPEIGVDQKQ
jgi:hypothetical protein